MSEKTFSRRTRTTSLFAVLCGFLAAPAGAQQLDRAKFFEERVRPVLADNCFACHTSSKLGGLRMTSHQSLLEGGNSGPAIVPGQPDRSLLIQAVRQTHERLKMPPEEKLDPYQIDDLEMWIADGAYWPDVGTARQVDERSRKHGITAEQRDFWAFRPVRNPSLPKVKNEAWVKSAIDRFVLAKLEAQGLRSAGTTDKLTLLRRAYFDLIGLPPTPEEVDAFLGDTSVEAFAAVIDRLLASKRYGERWGRHWLDVARYSDDRLNSTEMEPYPSGFRFRDWVIEAFNKDMPYDLFVKAQLAGDLLDHPDREEIVGGLGFYALSPQLQDDRIDATTRGFLALTVACARCHDHKFDPIPTEDYYALLGVFNSTETDEFPLASAEVVEQYEAEAEKVEDEVEALEEFIDTQGRQLLDVLAARTSAYVVAAWKVLGPRQGDPAAVAREDSLDQGTLERWVKYLGHSPRNHPLLDPWDDLLAQGAPEVEFRRLAGQFQDLVVSVIREKKEVDEENRIRTRGGTITRVELGKTELLSLERDRYFLWRDLAFEEEFELPVKFESGILYYGGEEIDRFLDGAWKMHLESMRAKVEALEARMPVKYPFFHIISDVPEPKNEYVRIRGNKDNLGDEVPRHFLSILSAGDPQPFSMGSGRLELAEAIAAAENPLTARVMVNRVWHHHFGQGIVRTPSNFGRMGERPSHPELLDYLAAWFIEHNWSLKALHREIMLSATYALSSENVPENTETDAENRWLWRHNPRRLDVESLRDSMLYVSGLLDLTPGGPPEAIDDLCNTRRTVYGYVSRRRLDTTFGLFDFPNPNVTSPRRIPTSTPLQGLFFLNSEFVMEQARSLAWRLREERSNNDTAKIRRMYRLLFSRRPTKEELRMGRGFVKADAKGWRQYTQVLLSSDEFRYVN